MEYPIGTMLECNGIIGRVIENVKLPYDICVQWEYESITHIISYDADWLDENARIIEELNIENCDGDIDYAYFRIKRNFGCE